MPPIISIENLVKRYKKAEKLAVDHVSFQVEAGEFFALLGPNGAGKTTTISILNTTLAKTSGKLLVAGYDVDTQPNQVRRSIGVIFQNPSLDENLTAEENIRFHAILYGVFPYRPSYVFMPKAYKDKVHELAEVLGIEDVITKPIKTFSGGMKRKLEIIRGLIHNPAVLFLDEPTTGLDPESRQNLWAYLVRVRKECHTTIFLTTHYLQETEAADHICIINHGKVVSFSSPQALKDQFVKEYLILDAVDRKALSAELKQQAVRVDGKGPFMVFVSAPQTPQFLAKLRTPITSLHVHAPTLEEAYLELVKNTKERKEDE